MKKQIISLLICIVMLISLMPITASANSSTARSYASDGNVFLGNEKMEFGINAYGSFGSTISAPSGFHPWRETSCIGLVAAPWGTYRDYFLPGTVDEGFVFYWNSAQQAYVKSNGRGNATKSDYTPDPNGTVNNSSGDILSATTEGTVGGSLAYTQNVSFKADEGFATMTVTLKNISNATLSGVEFVRGFDPDQGSSASTSNYYHIDGDGTVWIVATPTSKTGTFTDVYTFADGITAPFIFAAPKSNDYTVVPVYQPVGWDGYASFSEVSASSSDYTLNKSVYADKGIGLKFKCGDIASGDSVTITYYMSLDTDVSNAFDAITGAVSGSGINAATGDVTISLSKTATSFVVTVDGDELEEGVDYTITGKDTLTPVISFKAHAGLTSESVIAIQVTLEGESAPQTIPVPNNIPVPISFDITVAPGITNGMLEVDKVKAAKDETVTLTVTPALGYKIDTVKYNDGENDTVVSVSAGAYAFEMPAKAVTVAATFKLIDNIEAPAEITYDGSTFDVSTLFVKDTDAGEASYEIAVLGTSGEGAGALGADGKTLSISKAGVITVKMTTEANGLCAEGSVQTALTVKPGDGVGEVSVTGWTYGENSNAPVVSSETNGTDNVTYLYESTDGSGYISDIAPTNAGTYKVTATFAATELYTEAVDSAEFTVEKAEPVVNTAPTVKNITTGEKLSTSTITGGIMTGVDGNVLEGALVWKTPETVFKTHGKFNAVIVFTPNDTANYKAVEITVTVDVYVNVLPILILSSYCEVEFDTDGVGTIEKQTVRKGNSAEKPADPVKEGYTFGGWYTDEKCTEAYNFDAQVTKDITLYAKWTEVQVEVPDDTDTDDGTSHDNCPSLAFTDLDINAWYHPDVDYVLDKGIMVGMDDGIFGLDEYLSRAMLVTILWRLENKPTVDYSIKFEDVAADAWYADAVRWATSEGIVNGYSDEVFAPNDSITREQFAAILYRYEQHKGGGFKGMWMFQMDFRDVGDVSEWAYEPMCYVTMKGIITGKLDKILDPKGETTRVEAAAMLNRYLGKSDEN